MKSIITLTVAAFALASCGGGSNSTTRDVGILPSGFAATLDGATDEVVLTLDGVEVARLPNTGAAAPGFTGYMDGSELALYAETISGDGAVFVVSSSTANLGLAGVQVARLGDTDLPSSGSATFNGDYAGLFVDETLQAFTVTTGDAQLTADFGNASISGEITNRVVGGAADDVQLLPTAITSAGAFSGTATGGGIPGSTVVSSGAYVGLIVGDTGTEIVGGLTITHVGLADFFYEIGGFVAAE